jgi:acyl-CoA dehydrogenase
MSVATAVDTLLVETVERLLRASSTFEVVEQAERDGWCAPVWDAMTEAGFPWISIAEDVGGSGGTLADAMAVLRLVGRYAAPVPVAETGPLAAWLASSAGLPVPDGPASVVPGDHTLEVDDGRVRGEAVVAWGARSTRILAMVDGPGGPLTMSVDPAQLEVVARVNMAGEPRDLVRFDLALVDVDHAPAPAKCDRAELLRRGSLTRTVLSAGALEAMSQLTVDYTNDRRQFGRPVAAFQAVQQHLVTVAQCAVRAAMAADLATRAVAAGGGAFEVAAARVIVDAAAVEGTRAAHQAHGAMGVTREYRLHHLSRRLWAWRHEHGTVKWWRRQLGADVAEAGADALFPTIAR